MPEARPLEGLSSSPFCSSTQCPSAIVGTRGIHPKSEALGSGSWLYASSIETAVCIPSLSPSKESSAPRSYGRISTPEDLPNSSDLQV